MHILLKTPVEQSLPEVWAGFNRELFEKLSPAFPPIDLIRFDGSMPGDIVDLQLNFGFFKQHWVSQIVEQHTGEQEIYFIDRGVKLPFFLSYWQHRHRMLRSDDGRHTIIVDDITFRTPTRLTDYLFYPVMWVQFACRKPIYRRVFGQR